MIRKQVIAAWRPCGNNLSLLGRIESSLCFKGTKKRERPRSGCQEEKEGGIVKTNKSKTKPVSSLRCQRQAGAMKALQRVVWRWIFLGFGLHLVNAGEQEVMQQRMSEKGLHQIPQVDFPWKRMLRWGTCEGKRIEETFFFKKNKKKRNSHGKEPRTFDENGQGGDLSTLITNSQGEDPRTLKESVQRWRVQKKRKEKKWKQKDKKMNVQYTRSSWWKKAKERIESFFRGEVERRRERKERQKE